MKIKEDRQKKQQSLEAKNQMKRKEEQWKKLKQHQLLNMG